MSHEQRGNGCSSVLAAPWATPQPAASHLWINTNCISSSRCYNELTHPSRCKTTDVFSYSSGSQKPEMNLTRLKLRCWQDWIPLEASGENLSACLLQMHEASTFLGLWLLPSFTPNSYVCGHVFSDSDHPIFLLEESLWLHWPPPPNTG